MRRMPEEPHDPLPGIMAEMDQFLATFLTIAKAQKKMVDDYIEAGFEKRDAMLMASLFFNSGSSGSAE